MMAILLLIDDGPSPRSIIRLVDDRLSADTQQFAEFLFTLYVRTNFPSVIRLPARFIAQITRGLQGRSLRQ